MFTGTPGERPRPVRRNTYTKVEGEFIDSTTTRSEYVDHRTVQRAEIIKRTDNLTVGEGEFTVSNFGNWKLRRTIFYLYINFRWKI